MAVNVGLDIGTSAVRAAVVKTGGKGNPSLLKYGEIALPVGAVSHGEIVDEAVVSDAISQLFKANKIPKKRVVVGMANQRVIVRQISIPFIEESEFADSLEFQAQEYIPIPIDEAILDFVPIEEFSTPEGEAMMSVLIVAASKDMAQELLRVCGSVGIKPMAFDLQAFALVRAVGSSPLELDSSARALVNIGASLTQVVIVKNGTVQFFRIMPIGGDDFSTALVDSMSLDRDSAEQLKRRIGVHPEGTPPEGEGDAQALSALTTQADALIDEVRSSIDFFLSQSSGGSIDRVMISGNAARLPHLANRMRRSLNMAFEPIRVLSSERVTLEKKAGISDDEISSVEPVIPVVVGLALWGEDA